MALMCIQTLTMKTMAITKAILLAFSVPLCPSRTNVANKFTMDAKTDTTLAANRVAMNLLPVPSAVSWSPLGARSLL